jgi:hypothetical protein
MLHGRFTGANDLRLQPAGKPHANLCRCRPTRGFAERPAKFIFDQLDFVPKATLRVPISYFSALGHEIIHSDDDLDEFDGAVLFSVSLRLPGAVRHSAGYPEGTSTIPLPYELQDVEVITKAMSSLPEECKLQTTDLIWQRRDNPDL